MFKYIFILLLLIPALGFGQILSGSRVVNAGRSMEITVTVDVGQNEVEIVMTGTDGAYYAYGFGSSRMTNTYTILTQGNNITERKLGNHSAGQQLTSSFASSNYSVNAGIGTTTVTRAINGQNGDYFSFPTTPTTITIIWGAGSSNNFVRHNTRGATTITLTDQTPCENTTASFTEAVCDQKVSPSGLYTWTQTGTYKDTIPNAGGCDSIMTFDLTVTPSPARQITVTQCGTYTSRIGNEYPNTGTFQETRNASGLCDSIITLNLTILEANTGADALSSCSPITSPSGRFTYTESGTYNDTLTNNAGCDSVITLDIEILTEVFSTISLEDCDSIVSPSERFVWRSSGTYNDTIPSLGGCDSIITVNATIGSPEKTENISACDSYTSERGITYTQSGSYEETIAGPNCDTLVTLNLTIDESFTENQTLIGCEPTLSPSETFTMDENGIYRDTLTSIAGCDSILVIDFTLIEIDNTLSTTDSSLISNDGNADIYQWVDCNSNFAPIAGANESTFIPQITGSYALILIKGNCTDTSDCESVAVGSSIFEWKSGMQERSIFYPNPSNGKVTLVNDWKNTSAEIEILDQKGSVVFQFKTTDLLQDSINIPLQSGSYIARLTLNSEVFLQKILIDK